MLKNAQLKTEINYNKNLKQLLDLTGSEFSVLERSYGLVKGKAKEKSKISPVVYQRKIRKEWEKRLKRQYK